MRRLLFWLGCILLLAVSLPAFALAAAPPPQTPLIAPGVQVWTFAIGLLVPVVTYAINKYAPWTSEFVKSVVLALAAAVTAGVYQAISVGSVGFNTRTGELVLTAIVAAFGAHAHIWARNGVAAKLAGNIQANPRR